MEPIYILCFFLVLILVASEYYFYGCQIPRRTGIGACMGRRWKETFPQSSKASIRAFLQVFVDAFGFGSEDKLKFQPEDRISDIYDSLYPIKGSPDTMEWEELARSLEQIYGLRLEQIWSETLTLGEVYKATLPAR